MQNKILFVLLGVIVCIESIPKFDSACKNHDTACFNKVANVLYQSAIDGDAAYGVQVLDPAYNDLIQGKFGTLEYKLYNTTLLGFKKCAVTNSLLAENHRELSFVITCPLLEMRGSYESKGEVFSLPVDGKGTFTLECKDYIVTVDGKVKTPKRADGKEYLFIKTYIADGDLVGGMKFYMSNLFDGNKEFEETFYKVVNENWKELSKELQGPLVNINVKRAIINLNKILKAVSLDAIHSNE